MFETLGKITLFPYVFAPKGWMFCDGRQLNVREYEVLFYMMRNKFGGSDDKFGLPDLTKAAPENCRYCIATVGIYRPNPYEGIVGETMLSFEEPAAQNVLECKGQSLPKNQYTLLQQYLAGRFGGDANNFKLPDLQSKTPSGFHSLMCMEGEEPDTPNQRMPYVGELVLLPYTTNSDRFYPCDGRKIVVRDQPALFSLVGNNFGGDYNNFNLPDLRSAAPDKFNYYICHAGEFPQRQ